MLIAPGVYRASVRVALANVLRTDRAGGKDQLY
jgi:hypothetical protein